MQGTALGPALAKPRTLGASVGKVRILTYICFTFTAPAQEQHVLSIRFGRYGGKKVLPQHLSGICQKNQWLNRQSNQQKNESKSILFICTPKCFTERRFYVSSSTRGSRNGGPTQTHRTGAMWMKKASTNAPIWLHETHDTSKQDNEERRTKIMIIVIRTSHWFRLNSRDCKDSG